MTKDHRNDEAGQGTTRHRARQQCLWCHLPVVQTGTGRPRKYCSQACRQWDWVTRQRSAELSLSEKELVITREALDILKDRIYELACAVEDVEGDLEPGLDPTLRDYRKALEWVLEAARPLVREPLFTGVRR
jgi:endogenous inhibitor of DNA gyrase (YacG/DUF329 family)